MKKCVLFSLWLLLILQLCGGCAVQTVHVSEMENGMLQFVSGELSVSQVLTAQETKQMAEIFNGKQCRIDHPSCGFSEDVSISIGSTTFEVACDGCATVRKGNSDWCFSVSAEERQAINAMFETYGGYFPCV